MQLVYKCVLILFRTYMYFVSDIKRTFLVWMSRNKGAVFVFSVSSIDLIRKPLGRAQFVARWLNMSLFSMPSSDGFFLSVRTKVTGQNLQPAVFLWILIVVMHSIVIVSVSNLSKTKTILYVLKSQIRICQNKHVFFSSVL